MRRYTWWRRLEDPGDAEEVPLAKARGFHSQLIHDHHRIRFTLHFLGAVLRVLSLLPSGGPGPLPYATHTSLAPPLLPPLKADGQTASLREFYRLCNGSELSALCLVSVGE